MKRIVRDLKTIEPKMDTVRKIVLELYDKNGYYTVNCENSLDIHNSKHYPVPLWKKGKHPDPIIRDNIKNVFTLSDIQIITFYEDEELYSYEDYFYLPSGVPVTLLFISYCCSRETRNQFVEVRKKNNYSILLNKNDLNLREMDRWYQCFVPCKEEEVYPLYAQISKEKFNDSSDDR